MALPTTAIAPDAPTPTTPIDGALGIDGGAQQEIRNFIAAMSPPGSTVYKTGWTDLTYETGFGPHSFGRKPGWRRVADEIRLRGVATKTSGNFASGDTIATLPPGSRPAGAIHYFVVRGAGTSNLNIEVSTTGAIRVGSVNGTTAWISLDGLRLDLD